ncbi:hypothetical protein H1P_2960011 [Hyella patelloides LEGE 07179]|uniref:Uncharacterized protein n=2 Tax=Hyella TaxID=945733 RepID=A0A563VTS4_9CYAN|nr:hypothetical protein [Hyella patelloides]VEP14882.1 hypothetical protein H1P_2950001 [Hyella patelloides LEGE 07179]VEP14903.1 hypothetical protein H1P_2960011 [Hyella patelloides LEGE 07179]
MNQISTNKKSQSQPRERGKFAPIGDEPLSKKVTGVRLPVSIHQWVHDKPNYTEWVRKAIADAAEKEMKNVS